MGNDIGNDPAPAEHRDAPGGHEVRASWIVALAAEAGLAGDWIRANAPAVDAGVRRTRARALRAHGLTYKEIGALLKVSAETARRDCL